MTHGIFLAGTWHQSASRTGKWLPVWLPGTSLATLTFGYLDRTRPPNRPTSSRQAGDLAADVALPSVARRLACTSEASTYNFLYVYSCR